ncbi:MAG: hypothetical protein RSD81_06110 [Pseudomonas sp.]
MSMIDSARLKPASDAARAAQEAWHAAAAMMNSVSDSGSEEEFKRAHALVVEAREHYLDLAANLAIKVHYLVQEARREEQGESA